MSDVSSRRFHQGTHDPKTCGLQMGVELSMAVKEDRVMAGIRRRGD